ncbi:YeeE/YedE family protein [Candidatus Magnetoovum chiemensis]|nr:YeeE/YedE family protein [Candidatus Magnetoovum chiemensis]
MIDEIISRFSAIFDPDTIESLQGGTQLYGGFIIGILFGIVLQKGRVSKYDVVSGLFRLQDFTVFRLGTPLLIVAMSGVYLLNGLGMVELQVPKTVIFPQIVGGLLFGIAVAIMGYCPGTAAAALGEGSLDAIPSMLGLMAGAVIYAEFFHDAWEETVLTWGDIGRVTFPDMLGINPWIIIIIFIFFASFFLMFVTMYDWMLQFLKKSFSLFLDFTDTLEEKKDAAKETSVSAVKKIKERFDKR